jgi:hypothetical protein
MSVYQIIYSSHPFGFDDAMLNGILASARRNNRALGITGALICRADIYLQLLEGPEQAICKLASVIAKDNRHLDMKIIVAANAKERLFPNWDMLDDPAHSWMWDQAAVAAGAVDKARPDEVRGIFTRVAAEHAV